MRTRLAGCSMRAGFFSATGCEEGSGLHPAALDEPAPVAPALPDAHFHLGFVADKAEFIADAALAGGMVFAASVTPDEYWKTRSDLARCSDWADEGGIGAFGPVRLAVGLHPWWVPADEAQLETVLAAFDEALSETRFVGEVGLDFSKRREATRNAQLLAFRHIAKQCAEAGGKILSIHCVKAYDDALRILNGTYLLRGDGCFSTVDLLHIDLTSGEAELLKWGAAPSYLRCGDTVKKLGTASLPPGVGVGGDHAPERYRLSLRGGEMLVLVSDGAGDAESAVAGFAGDSPRELAALLIAGLPAEDDMTAVAVALAPRASRD